MSYHDFLNEQYGLDEGPAAGPSYGPSPPNQLQQYQPPHYSQLGQTESLVPVSRLPKASDQKIFSFQYFNKVQSRCFDTIFCSNENAVIAAPTGSGKTALLELAILRLFRNDNNFNANQKAIYIAPLKALVEERYEDWKERLPQNITCAKLTGDTDTPQAQLNSANIILTTPEKWDSMTRHWTDNKVLMHSIGLILIDEVHLLNESRGSVLEGIVSRCKMLQRACTSLQKQVAAATMRIIALSATIPNHQDIAEWLGGRDIYFGDEYRPVPLEYNVIGYSRATNPFLFEASLNKHLFGVIQKYSSGKPSLIFCATRKGTVQSAQAILASENQYSSRNRFGGFFKSESHRNTLKQHASRVTDAGLQTCLRQGIGIHTGGLSYADRHAVEALFRKGDLLVLCTTTTLSQGVNLPAHLVIVKSTQQYRQKIGYTEYERSTIMQMIGRAGRPQYDTSGVAVIMTQNHTVRHYEQLPHTNTPIESNLLGNMVEHINAEISLNTLTNIADAIDWIKSTFLYIRMKRNPQHYGATASPNQDPAMLNKKLQELCLKEINRLAKQGMAETDELTNLKPTTLGKLMSRYYISFETAAVLNNITPDAKQEDLLWTLAKSGEFKELSIRMGEKGMLNAFNKGSKLKGKSYPRVVFPIKGGIKTVADKIFILAQVALARSTVDNFNLKMDMETVCTAAGRLMKCMAEYVGESRNMCSCLITVLTLKKSFAQKIWSSGNVLQQLPKIGPVIARTLAEVGITTFQALKNTSAPRIEGIVGRREPFGAEVLNSVQSLPVFALDIWQEGVPEDNVANIKLELTQSNSNFKFMKSKSKYGNKASKATVIVGNHHNYCLLNTRVSITEHKCSTFTWNLKVSKGEVLQCKVIYDDLFGVDIEKSFNPTFLSGNPGPSSNNTAYPSRRVKPDPSALSNTSETSSFSSSTQDCNPPPQGSKSNGKKRLLGCKHSHAKCLEGKCLHHCCRSLSVSSHSSSSNQLPPKRAKSSASSESSSLKQQDNNELGLLRSRLKTSSIPGIKRAILPSSRAQGYLSGAAATMGSTVKTEHPIDSSSHSQNLPPQRPQSGVNFDQYAYQGASSHNNNNTNSQGYANNNYRNDYVDPHVQYSANHNNVHVNGAYQHHPGPNHDTYHTQSSNQSHNNGRYAQRSSFSSTSHTSMPTVVTLSVQPEKQTYDYNRIFDNLF